VERAISISGGPEHNVRATRGRDSARIWIDGLGHVASLTKLGDLWEVRLDEHSAPIHVYAGGDIVYLHAFGRSWTAQVVDPAERAALKEQTSDVARAPMPGVVVALSVAAGDSVTKGQSLVIIESMKMQTELFASRDGVVDRVTYRVGESFERNSPLVLLKPTAAEV
jgi:acetyl/propionyl-CoA carboxylase alpha subunit